MTTAWELLAQQLLVVLAAASAALTVAVTARQVALAPRGGKALAAYRDGGAAPVVEVDINSALGLVKPAYARYLYLGAVATVVVLLLVAGMPLAPGAGRRRAGLCTGGRIPERRPAQGAAGDRAGAAHLREPAGRHAAGHRLPARRGRGDHGHLDRRQAAAHLAGALLAGWQAQGEAFLAQAHLEANQISPLLGLTVYQIRRLAETGGAGAAKAFATTAEELSAILEARAVASSKAEGARQAVLTMLVIMAVILGIMLSSPTIRQGYNDPTAQLVAAGALAVMGFGYVTLNGMIAEALEG